MDAIYVSEGESVKLMEKIGVCQAGIDIMKSRTVFRLIYITNIRNAIANILKQEMISYGGDVAVHEGCINCTIDKSDVLIMGTIEQIKMLIKSMRRQVSESKDVANVLTELIKDGKENEKS